MWVLVHNETGKYVAGAGEQSYTDRLEDAVRFTTREAAERERCVESEHVAALDSLTRGPVRG